MTKYLIILPGIYPHVVPAAADDAYCRCIQQWWGASLQHLQLIHVLFILLYKIIIIIIFYTNLIPFYMQNIQCDHLIKHEPLLCGKIHPLRMGLHFSQVEEY